MHLPAGAPPELEGWDDDDGSEEPPEEPSTSARPPSTTRSSSARWTTPRPTGSEEIGGSTRAMQLGEIEWEDVEDPPRRRDDEA